jgi:eukaryotic-like serine/threonine-protein kinase
MALDRAVDAFIDGRMDFEMFRQALEEQLAQCPADAGPAISRLDALRAAGRLSAAMHAVVYDEIKRSARGDITAPINAASDAASPARDTVPEAPPRVLPVLTRTRDEQTPPAVFPGVGTVLAGRYRLEALLERGGMSLVFRAGDLRRITGESGPAKVGVKLAGPEPPSRQALEHEAALLAGLSHPGIIRMLGFDHEGESAFMVMELLEGERLRGRLVRSHPEPLPEAEALGLTRQLATALAYLHGRGFVHRDVKPANIFVTATGELRLIDFGLASRAGGAHQPGDEVPKAWTPLYASPQMLAREPPDSRDDVYSLGCVVYEMLSGRHPWGNVTAPEAAERKLRPSRPAGLRRHRWTVLRRSLSFSAADRPADAAAFLAEFFPPARPRRLLPWVAAAFIGGLAAGMALRGDRPDPALSEAPMRESIESPAPVVAPPPAPETGQAEESPPGARPPPAEEAPKAEEIPDAEGSAGIDREPFIEPAAAPAVPAPAAPAPAPASLSLAADRFRVVEGAGALRLELRRPAGYRGPLNVRWRTVDQTARDGVDFSGSTAWEEAGTLPGAPSLVIFIPIVDDSRPGPDLTFRVELEQAPEGPVIGAPAAAEVTIVDDD